MPTFEYVRVFNGFKPVKLLFLNLKCFLLMIIQMLRTRKGLDNVWLCDQPQFSLHQMIELLPIGYVVVIFSTHQILQCKEL